MWLSGHSERSLEIHYGNRYRILVTIEGEKGKIIELNAKKGSKMIHGKLKDVNFPRGAIVSAIVRGKEIIIPDGNQIILPDDKIVIFTLPAALAAVEGLFS